MQRDKLLVAAKWLVTLFGVLNILAALVFIGLLVFSFAFQADVLAMLAKKYGEHALVTLNALRAVVLIGVGSAVPIHAMLLALRRMLRTAEAGDPFVPENARRLHLIGWSLVALQLLHIPAGVLFSMFAEPGGGDANFDWSPTITGWLAVLMVFVLARVFVTGTRMRDELAMTV